MNKLIAMLCVWNEADKFLKECLFSLNSFVDKIVILDDGSTDTTVEICQLFPKVVLYRLEKNLGQIDESKSRKMLFDFALKQEPDWILAPDADEIFEDRFIREVRKLMKQPVNWFSFHRIDFWTMDKYFADLQPSMCSMRLMFRNLPGKSKSYLSMKIHGPRTPAWIFRDDNKNGISTDFRIKHYGFIKKESRIRRIEWNEKYNVSWYLKTIYQLEKDSPEKLTQWSERI